MIFFHTTKADIIFGVVYYFGIAVHCKRSEFQAILREEVEDTFEEERVDPQPNEAQKAHPVAGCRFLQEVDERDDTQEVTSCVHLPVHNRYIIDKLIAEITHDPTTKKGKGLNKCHSGNNLRATTRLGWLMGASAKSLCCVMSSDFRVRAIQGCGGVTCVGSFLMYDGFILGI